MSLVRYQKRLKDFNEEQLKTISEKMEITIDFMDKKVEEAMEHYGEMRDLRHRFKAIRDLARIEIGRRKGTDCPALSKGAYCSCLVQPKARYSYYLNTIFKYYCSKCKLSPEKAKKRMIMNKIFDNGRKV